MEVDSLLVDGEESEDIDMNALAEAPREIAEPTAIQKVAATLSLLNPVDLPLEHILTDGIYTRIIHMPTGSLVVGMKHKTTHPFFILRGSVDVLKEKEGVEFNPAGEFNLMDYFDVEGHFEAGMVGVTHIGVKRFLRVIEDTVWAACVPNPDNIEDPDIIAWDIMIQHEVNPLAPEDNPRFNLWKKSSSPSIVHNLLLK